MSNGHAGLILGEGLSPGFKDHLALLSRITSLNRNSKYAKAFDLETNSSLH